MHCNRDEAVRAKDMAESLLSKMEPTDIDFIGARNFALKAQRMDPNMDNIAQLLLVCEVHCAATQNLLFGTMKDWYNILQVEPTADESVVRKQYRKLALMLHPDKNNFSGAKSAFVLVKEAFQTLTNKEARTAHDKFRRLWRERFQKQTETANHQTQTANHQTQTANHQTETANHQTQTPNHQTQTPNHQTQTANHQTQTPNHQTQTANHQTQTPNHQTQTPNYETQTPNHETETQPPNFRNTGASPPTASSAKKTYRKRKCSELDDVDVVNLSDDDVTELNEEKKTPEVHSSTSSATDSESSDDAEEVQEEEESCFVDYDAPDFCDFGKLREKNCFRAGQVWAVYDEEEGMPRLYALITEVSYHDFMLQYKWLETLNQKYKKRPVFVGNFEVGALDQTTRCSIFSHLVCSITRRLTRGLKITIFPKKGETWALFRNWDNNSSDDSVSRSIKGYDLVEILSDFESGTKLSVGSLSIVEGFTCVFTPSGRLFEIPHHEFRRFSHSIPSFRLTGKEGRGVREGWYELDPAALPAR